MKFGKRPHSKSTVDYLDVGHHPVPHVTEAWVEGAFNPPDMCSDEARKAIRISDDLVDQFLSMDAYVISSPMYNLNVPSTLKAYIDQIVRVNRTFSQEYEGMVHGKKMLVITARGNIFKEGSPFAPYDLQEPYFRAIFGFIGIADINFIHCEGTNLGDDIRSESIRNARAALKELAETW